MGFGFNLFVVFGLPVVIVLLLIIWWKSGWKVFITLFTLLCIGAIGIVILSIIVQRSTANILLEKKDYYGKYIINRNYFPGKQADWQYNNFRFEIKKNDSIYFYVINKEKITKTYRGVISTIKPYSSERLIINMEQPTYHIMASNPTIYRSPKGFYLVFHSEKFNNVYFRQGEWVTLDK